MKHYKTWLIILIIAIFGIRLWYSLNTPGFSSDESYFHVRQVESILSTGLPFWHDTLAWGGRQVIFSPVYDYFLAGFAYVFGANLGLSIGAELLATLLSLVVALLAYRLTMRAQISLLAGALIAITPVWVGHSLNQLWPQSLAILLLTLLLLVFETYHSYWIAILVAFTHPLSIVWIAVSAGMVFLLWLAKIRNNVIAKTSIISFIIAVINFAIWLPALMLHGMQILNPLPQSLVAEFVGTASVLGILLSIGVLPVLGATITTYVELFNSRAKNLVKLISLAIICAALLASPLGPKPEIIILLSISVSLLFVAWSEQAVTYWKSTRLAQHTKTIAVMVTLLVLFTTALPLATVHQQLQNSFSYKDQLVLQWIAEKTPIESTILAIPTEGQRIASQTNRKTVLDTTFTGRTDGVERAKDVQRLYQTSIELEAIQLLDKYNADYIFL
ncbi:MAG: hypothetical protein Q7K43_04405, partial [Candidatus Woesearchaeota archaeon]|nr:hypothetical protein [Candidatus Woesearchaeota archaeon]